MLRAFQALLAAGLALYLTAPAAAAQAAEVRTDTPSGYPVPRFVSLKGAKTYCRLGPSFDHPVVVTFLRQGMPVQVIAETSDHWRKIRDRDGVSCWAHKTTLRAVTHAAAREETLLRARPETDAPVRARLAAGVLVRLGRSEGAWRQVFVDGLRGWAPAAALWGAAEPADPAAAPAD